MAVILFRPQRFESIDKFAPMMTVHVHEADIDAAINVTWL